MTCEYNAGPGWQVEKPAGLLCDGEKTLISGGKKIIVKTGGKHDPTKVYVFNGDCVDLLSEGKIRSSFLEGFKWFTLYGNGASVIFANQEDPYYLAVTNLPKEQV